MTNSILPLRDGELAGGTGPGWLGGLVLDSVRIAVILPCYNEEAAIAETIAGIQKRSGDLARV